MSGTEIHLQAQYRARVDESVEKCHALFIGGMLKFGPPLGLRGLRPPSAPCVEPGSASAIGVQRFRYPIPGLELQMTAQFRHERSIGADKAINDDRISLDFNTSNKALDYRTLLHEDFPKVIEAYRGYRAWAMFGTHGQQYTDCFWNKWKGRATTNAAYRRLRQDPRIDIDGRNNIFTLEPAVFWDAQLCHQALGYGPDEVIFRLKGRALLVRPVLDGVYIVFDDDPALSYDAYVEMNQQFKRLLDID